MIGIGDLKAGGQKARDRYIEIAAALEDEAGVREHKEHKKISGQAWLETGRILAPAGVTRRQLHVLAHECGHIVLYSTPKRRKATHVQEHEAECYAHRALAAYGVEVPERSTLSARVFVARRIREDRAMGIPICPMAEAFVNGTRPPYASLRAVDAHRRRKGSVPDTITCGTCRYRSGSQCKVHLKDHSYAWRGDCNRGQSWRPLRRALLARFAKDLVDGISGHFKVRRLAQQERLPPPTKSFIEIAD